MDPNQNPKSDSGETIIGIVTIGLITVGIAGLISTFMHRDGTGLIASSLSFGMLGWWAMK